MDAKSVDLPWNAPLAQYEAQAAELLADFHAGQERAVTLFHENLPRFLDATVTWLPLPISDEEIKSVPLTLDDARLALASHYSFRDWLALVALVNDVANEASPTHRFERASEAVIRGDVDGLRAQLRAEPELVRARSTRITGHDPEMQRATLLHYSAANGVEGYRQKSPANAVEVARLLLESGAQVDALADMYGAQCTTLSMLVSSTPPAGAGVLVPLVHVLMDHGADPEGAGTGNWKSPLLTALVFGFVDAANALVERGAQINDVVKAAGLGRVDACMALLPSASPALRHQALAIAAITGHVETVRVLLDAGEDPDRMNPEGFHSHSTPLHQAACAGHLAVVRLLVERGARTDIPDALWKSDVLGWAEHCDKPEIVAYLRGRARGAELKPVARTT